MCHGLYKPSSDNGIYHTGEQIEMSNTLGMKVGQRCNFFGCNGIMKFKGIEYHELDRKVVEKCDLSECPKCGVQALSRSSEV